MDCDVATAIYWGITAVVILTIFLIFYIAKAQSRSQTERMEPYASWLSYDILRSDPAFDKLRDRPPSNIHAPVPSTFW